jgi:hypothetical protein
MKRILFLNFLFLFIITTILKAYDGITPGEKWNDTNGTQINAHGGCVVFHEGAYYWFGEDRNVFYSNGVSCYKSSDLYNWTKLGLAFTPSGAKDPNGNDAAPGRTFERPKVIYNNATGKWVMWIHWENGDDYGDAKVCVATSDKILGPYTFYKTYRPNGHDSRDQTLFKDTDGKAYHFGTTNMNSHILVSELTNNYLEVTGKEYLALKGMSYEAPAIFKVGDTYFGLFSGCTGWDPNPGRTAYTFDLMDEWTIGDNFCVDLGKETSYKSQSAYVFKVNGHENAYVYVGDRWVSTNPGSSNVVWLPLSMRSGYPTVRWMSKWDVSVFDEYDRYKRAKELISANTYLLLEKNSNRFVSQTTKDGLIITDDDAAINLKFNIIETAQPYTYKIQEAGSGKYFESVFGSLRLNTENNSKAQEWLFLLQEDGYYKIKNLNDSKYFAISGGGTYANSGVYLSDASKARCFGVYFDSNNFKYEAADIFSASYKNEIKVKINQQNEILSSTNNAIGIDEVDFDVYPSLNNGNFIVKAAQSTIHYSNQIQIRLYDGISGKLVHEQIDKNYTNTSVSVNLAGKLNSGMYLVKITIGDITTIKKIIVQ